KDALENGVAMVHQELNQCLERNVLDNLYMGRYPLTPMGMVDEKRMKNEAADLFRRLNMTVNLTAPMKTMSVSARQMVEIAKAISYNAKLIVLDEPTSSLTVREVAKLFEMMRNLKAQGISLVYISHKMDEIFEICDEISVLRDGNMVMTKKTQETDMNELIAAMVGRALDNRFPPVDNTPGDTVLSVQHLSTKFEPNLKDITFDVREGEIFGLYGLVGAGRTELLETMFGVRTRAAGRVYYKGRLMNFTSSEDAMDHSFAMITEERKSTGLFLEGDLTFNTTITNLSHYRTGIALSKDKMVKATANEINIMHTKCMGPSDSITALSGGNQQKVVFGKWLERDPAIFLMDEPTRGIDVGAKYEIYELIIKMAKMGKTIIVVSSEMPEILGITNRIGVMSNGRLAGIVNTRDTNQEELLRLSAKYL
ncbi:MAG: sugar ABC transporter ATP-binding protein, partial [Clostridia bacterium]|nr:sugar ABC transporter ATP-binding protein [Clostridia bacterium]